MKKTTGERLFHVLSFGSLKTRGKFISHKDRNQIRTNVKTSTPLQLLSSVRGEEPTSSKLLLDAGSGCGQKGFGDACGQTLSKKLCGLCRVDNIPTAPVWLLKSVLLTITSVVCWVTSPCSSSSWTLPSRAVTVPAVEETWR